MRAPSVFGGALFFMNPEEPAPAFWFIEGGRGSNC